MGYITRFKPSMVELHPDGSTTVPPVWDLHLHHVVWADRNGNPAFGAGEEKTISKMPRGYGALVAGGANWFINQMLHSLNASVGRQVELTWEIDWVPAIGRPEAAEAALARRRRRAALLPGVRRREGLRLRRRRQVHLPR